MENEYERVERKIARLIGEPINTQLPVALELSEIADTFTAAPGEHAWRIKNLDETADVILQVNSDGKIIVIKRTPLVDIELSFTGYNSKKEYILVEDILNKVDTDALSRRKESITRAMDKRELKSILDAILTPTNAVFPYNEVGGTEISITSGDDLYDVIIKAKQALEDYGDNYVLLCGSNVKGKIDTYDKDKAATFNYNVTLNRKLEELGIKVMKVFGKVAEVLQASTNTADGERALETSLLDTSHFILIARNSRISEGKPIQFVRRRIDPAIAKLMGADVDNAQRALWVSGVPEHVNFSDVHSNVLGFGIYGYQSVVMCIKNPKSIAWCDASTLVD